MDVAFKAVGFDGLVLREQFLLGTRLLIAIFLTPLIYWNNATPCDPKLTLWLLLCTFKLWCLCTMRAIKVFLTMRNSLYSDFYDSLSKAISLTEVGTLIVGFTGMLLIPQSCECYTLKPSFWYMSGILATTLSAVISSNLWDSLKHWREKVEANSFCAYEKLAQMPSI